MMRAMVLLGLLGIASSADGRVLKVCADPNNLPFSNDKEQGFENKIVRIVAEELKADVQYVWHAQRRGNVRETINAGQCDIIPGVASSVELLATTRPYYRSTYVAVVRDGALDGLDNFDDPRLSKLKIGVQLIGADGQNTPPAHALSARGLVANIRGYTVYGDYDSPAPQSSIVDAVAHGDIDLAFVWGPTAAYFAKREPVKLSIAALPMADGPGLPMVFDISMGVRRDNLMLRRELDAALVKRATDIKAVLSSYGVPLVKAP
jgi:mxaJ protein